MSEEKDIVKKIDEKMLFEKQKREVIDLRNETFASSRLDGIGLLAYESPEYRFGKFDKQVIETAMKDFYEESNLKLLRQFSEFAYMTDEDYGNAIDNAVDSHLMIPLILPTSTTKDLNKFNKAKMNKKDFLDALNKTKLSHIAKTTLKLGLYAGYIINKNGFYIQDLPVEQCRVNYFKDGYPVVEFDFSYFDGKEDMLTHYPTEFYSKFHDVYQKNKQMKWIAIDYKKTFVSYLPHFAPRFMSAFPMLFAKKKSDAEFYKGIGLENVKFAHQKIPYNKDNGDILANTKTVEKFHNNIRGQLVNDIRLVTTPYEIDFKSFTDNKMNNSSDKREYIDSRTRKALLYSNAVSGDAKSISGYKLYAQMLEGAMTNLLGMIAKRIEMELNSGNGKTVGFIYQFLNATIHNRDEMVSQSKSLVGNGGSTILPMMILNGMDYDECKSLIELEKHDGIYQENKISESQTGTGQGVQTENGESNKERELNGEK